MTMQGILEHNSQKEVAEMNKHFICKNDGSLH